MTATVDVTVLADLLRRAAKTEILPRFRRLGQDEVRAKSEATDLVTEADEQAERMIKAEAERLWPQALFLGEESVAAEPALLGRLADADLAIVVDPVDGTFNFAAGIPAFGVMASVISGGETIAGIIYDPMGDDWVMAERGAGAYLRRPDGATRRLKVAEPVPLARTIAHVSIGFLDPKYKVQVLGNLAKLAISANYRVAGHDYRTMASGHCHAVMFNKLMPWDHLPGTLISAEAGAYVRKFDGSEYGPSDLSGGLLLATDKDSWSLLRREVFTV